MIEDRRQKKVRLERSIDSFEMELDELKEEVKRQQSRMESVKIEICKVKKNDDIFSAENINREARFVNRLQELEEEAVKLEDELDGQRRNDEGMNTEIIDSEQQAMLWNKQPFVNFGLFISSCRDYELLA
ncbi:MAG: hypothetical protein EZS28_022142 [Streblomastix strix]|uniref:Uncharacterized protein n=1 Tax=Streblomastix strix TaxID=222440 RepID=A0A5J4VJ95_9EUKA|nr:MAG: hypothetical protein EZS28_022142 [Streblomastix strix]